MRPIQIIALPLVITWLPAATIATPAQISRDFKKLDMEFPEKSLGFMGGGNTLITLDGKVRFSANITPDEKTGIGTWTRARL